MIVDDLRESILQLASEGNLVSQNNAYSASKELEHILIDEKDNKKYVYEKVLEVPFQIPENWIWVKLEDICLKITDGTHSTPKYTNSGIPFISVKDVSGGYINFDNTKFISKEEHDKLFERCNPEVGDLLITKVGTTGVPAIIDTTNQFSLFVSVALLKINSKKINNKFLYYFLKSPIVQKQVKENTRGVGNKNWVLDAIKNTILPLPPLEEQQRIVNKIESLFAKLDEIKPIEEELIKSKIKFPEDMKNTLLESAIKGNLVLNNINELPVLDETNYSCENLFNIPSNWRWSKIDDVIDIQTGLSFKKIEQCNKSANALRVLRGGNINNNNQYILKDDDVYVNYTDKYIRLLEGDVITPSVTSMEQMGKTGYIDKNLDKITAGGFVYIMRTKNKNILLPKYMMYFINSKFHKNMCKPNIHKSGQAFYNLKKSGLILQPIPLPPLEEQQRIVDKLEQLLPLCNDLAKILV